MSFGICCCFFSSFKRFPQISSIKSIRLQSIDLSSKNHRSELVLNAWKWVVSHSCSAFGFCSLYPRSLRTPSPYHLTGRHRRTGSQQPKRVSSVIQERYLSDLQMYIYEILREKDSDARSDQINDFFAADRQDSQLNNPEPQERIDGFQTDSNININALKGESLGNSEISTQNPDLSTKNQHTTGEETCSSEKPPHNQQEIKSRQNPTSCPNKIPIEAPIEPVLPAQDQSPLPFIRVPGETTSSTQKPKRKPYKKPRKPWPDRDSPIRTPVTEDTCGPASDHFITVCCWGVIRGIPEPWLLLYPKTLAQSPTAISTLDGCIECTSFFPNNCETPSFLLPY